jgi:hypothetical protein
MNRETKTNYNKIIKEPEPTAMEFQDAFREAMEIVANSKSRLIIVVDNLDRLPEAEAIAMWSTIRSFFLGGDKGLRSRKSRHEPVVILPIAEDAIQRIYSDSDTSLAKSFIEKTFDLTFYVNRPVLTKWTEFLHHQMTYVFGDEMDESWPFVTGRFYERYSAWSGFSTITPRGINTLVNAIATRWLQWQGVVSFETVSYYCTFREAIEKDSKTVTQESSDKLVMALANTGQVIDWSKDIETVSAVIRIPLNNPSSLGTALLVLGLYIAQVGAPDSTVVGLSADLLNRLNEAHGQKHDLVTARSVVALIYIGQPFARCGPL